MPVTVLQIPAAAFPALPDSPWPVVEVGVGELAADETARLLAAAARGPDGFQRWAAAGLAADARGRPGRTVRAWAAVRPQGSFSAVVALAEASVAGGRWRERC